MLGKIGRVLTGIMVGLVLLPGTVEAQTDDSAREIVLQAFDAINALEGYHFRIKYYYIHKLIMEDGSISEQHSIQTVEGEVVEGGKRQFTRTQQTGLTYEDAAQVDPITVDVIIMGNDTYLNFQFENTVLENQLGLASGWWRLDDALNSINNSSIKGFVEQSAQPDFLFERAFRDVTMLNVLEGEPDVVEGNALRVFDVELDGLRMLMESSYGMDVDMEAVQNTYGDLFAASDVSLNYRLWIGVEDELLYRGKGNQRTYIPYLTMGGNNNPSFDVEDTATIEFAVSQHGEVIDIQPPDESLLNE